MMVENDGDYDGKNNEFVESGWQSSPHWINISFLLPFPVATIF